MIRCKEKFGGILWVTYLLDADVAITACLTTMTAALSFGSSYCLASSAAMAVEAAFGAETAVDVTTIAVETTAVSGSSYCFSSAVMVSDSAAVAADAATHGTTVAETTVAANFFGNSLGGIFGCPSCHGSNPAMIETLKLFLPYFPLHIQNLISMYLKFLEFMHTFEMIQNMMNHMDEYQALFKMFESMGGESSSDTSSPSALSNPLNAMAPFFGSSGFSMPDLGSMQKMMEGSDLVDEFTYVEEPSGSGRHGS